MVAEIQEIEWRKNEKRVKDLSDEQRQLWILIIIIIIILDKNELQNDKLFHKLSQLCRRDKQILRKNF